MRCDCELMLHEKQKVNPFSVLPSFPYQVNEEFHQRRRIAAIVPIFNESPEVVNNLRKLAVLTEIDEILISDASNNPNTVDAINKVVYDFPNKIRIFRSDRPQRASQMNLAARSCNAQLLWFVHADTTVPPSAPQLIQKTIQQHRWGRFDIRFDNHRVIMKVVAWLMNNRSALSGICTGDQAIFVQRDLFESVGRYPAISLMEDVVLSKRLKQFQQPARIRLPVQTSARRWEANGYLRTIALMWGIRLLHSLGASPTTLRRLYGQVRG